MARGKRAYNSSLGNVRLNAIFVSELYSEIGLIATLGLFLAFS
jgi:hypothetical protein